ncbi:hypothetical protein BIY29_01275 [Brenneria alni]|uniref:Transglutaminase-like domain-containing protein n=2 Tax=Brenneria alni TaxID=71656 RepID=A0A421DT68_9GAMM|nr:hypothetical protein BIY29_01275 [Brenneria alni]
MVNPLHDRYFPGGVTVNPLENFSQEHVVKLHEAVSAHTLGIGSYEGRHISVNSSTMEHLRLAQDTLRKVKMMLPYGAGNQKTDIIYTGGESWARTEMARCSLSRDPIDYALQSARHQAGNCSEMTSLSFALLAQQRINAPVLRVCDREWNHSYVLIGDPRDQTWGERNTVVVDPWVTYPSAATLDQTVNRNPISNPMFQRARNAPPIPEAQALNRISHITTNEVANYLSSHDLPSIGDALLQTIYPSEGRRNLCDEKIVARDPSTLYSSGFFHSISSMDDIAQATINRQHAAQQVCNTSGYRE